jgi:hypothetical protein
MCARKSLWFLIIALSVTNFSYAQRSANSGKSSYTRSRHNYSAPRVRGNKAKIICPVFENSKYPYHGIGFKLGDPFALTYKFYPNKRVSFAVDFGKASSGLYNHYFREKYDEYIVSDTVSAGASLIYTSHKVKADLIGEFKFLYHFDAKKISPGLQAYIGAGWEWKNTQLRYDYYYNSTDAGNNEISKLRHFDRNRFTMGPQVIVGIEYSYFQIPISAFMELEYFTDIQADPGWQRFEGGVGLRYIF